ncbi:AGC family protein kinase [Tritrichomonas foetus]|uniref:non-specific serine/threonine protein kinase n=1 Tax=Tritrichomonas foetus TaxID=1144522 RepID=A0A1J4JIT1_9EUKA|nr:AGC family protein kinase [Tritrichomonas foetus]|eukprot:OHS97467.1 AGC family protein kinase [Tritrichomonas foetus]
MFQDYDLLNMIGEGSFGRVYKARRRYTGRLVAIKLINKLGQNAEDIITLRREIDILSKVNHPNIMKMIDVFETDTNFCIVTELARGDLFQVIDDEQILPESALKPIAAQLVSALCHLHKSHIIHRDLKPQNILVGANGSIKVCDFGFARALSQTTLMLTSIKGTPLYMAPELVQEQPYNESIDIWSLGIILYELFHGSPPFFTESIYKLIQMIINNPIKYPDTMSEEFVSFLQMMLEKNPSRRATAEDLLNHPFIKDEDISIFDEKIYNYKSTQFENAIKESLTPDSNSNFKPPKSNKLDYQMVFLSPSSYSTEEVKKALKYLKESNQNADSPLVASFATNIMNFLKDQSIIVDVISAATYVLQLDRERYTPQLLSIASILGQPNIPIEMISFVTELLVIPYAHSKVFEYPYDSSFLKLDEEKAVRLRDVLLSFIFTPDQEILIETYVFISYLLQVSSVFFTTVCGDFTPQFAPLIVSAFTRSESSVVRCAALSILTQIVLNDPTSVYFIQPLDPFFDAIKAMISNDPESLESFCCFTSILTFFKASFKELKRIPKFMKKFDDPENITSFVMKIFDGDDNFINRLGLLLMFSAQEPTQKSEFLGYACIICSLFTFLSIDEKTLTSCSNYITNIMPYHQPPLLKNILKLDKEEVLSVLTSLVSLFESQAATSIFSEYILEALTPELADELLENDALLSLAHVISEMGPNVPAPTVLVLAKLILSFNEAGALLFEQSREVLTSIFSVEMAAESGLIIASHFARLSSAFLPSLSECGAINLAARGLLADIPRIRGRALDFIGNYCRHAPIPDDFMNIISKNVIDQINGDDVDCLKMASYALSNMLFYSPQLSDAVLETVSVEKLNEIINNEEYQDQNPKIIENIVSMCANLVRKSDDHLMKLIDGNVLFSILTIVKDGGSIGARALLQLSVFCQYKEARIYLKKNKVSSIIEQYSSVSNDRIQRTYKKLMQCFE